MLFARTGLQCNWVPCNINDTLHTWNAMIQGWLYEIGRFNMRQNTPPGTPIQFRLCWQSLWQTSNFTAMQIIVSSHKETLIWLNTDLVRLVGGTLVICNNQVLTMSQHTQLPGPQTKWNESVMKSKKKKNIVANKYFYFNTYPQQNIYFYSTALSKRDHYSLQNKC